MKKRLIVMQQDSKDCGSAALLSIIRFYGGDISLSKLVEMTETDKTGTNFLNIKKTAQKLGLNAEGYKVDDIKYLYQIEKPYIAQIYEKKYFHFVVVYKLKDNRLTIMDPAKGKIIVNIDSFGKIFSGNIMIFEQYKNLLVLEDTKILNKEIAKVIIANKSLIYTIFFISIIFTIISCIITYYFQIILDYAINTKKSNLIIITTIFLILSLYKIIANYFRCKILIYLNQKLDLSLFLSTFNKILLLPYSYYKVKQTGEILSRVNDIVYIRNAISKLIITVFLDLIVCLFSGIILYIKNKELFMVLLITNITYLILMTIINKFTLKFIKVKQIDNAKINSFLVETINAFETVKGLNLETIMNDRFEKMYTKSLNHNLIYEMINNIQIFISDFIDSNSNILIIFLGSLLIIDKKLEISSLVTFNFLANYFINPVKNIASFAKEYYYMKNSLKRANDLFEIETESKEKRNIVINGDIYAFNLNFKYGANEILENACFFIKHGEKVLLLGESGSGKSTLLKLIFKYLNTARNELYLDNLDINDYKLQDIRENITYISQNEQLFNDTLRNNIILDRNISEEQFYEVARMTYVDDIIKDNIGGFDIMIEEGAFNISGGQKQKIMLARALLKNSKIILMDEATSEIDIKCERKILENIFNIFYDKTIIVVSHRQNNIDLFSKILKLENKKVNVIS